MYNIHFDSDLFLYTRNLYLCSSALNSQRLLCSEKASVKYIKAFWYTNLYVTIIYIVEIFLKFLFILVQNK